MFKKQSDKNMWVNNDFVSKSHSCKVQYLVVCGCVNSYQADSSLAKNVPVFFVFFSLKSHFGFRKVVDNGANLSTLDGLTPYKN